MAGKSQKFPRLQMGMSWTYFFGILQQTMFDWQSVFVIFCNDPFPVVKRGNWKSHKSPIH
jgi:hypothetical protein